MGRARRATFVVVVMFGLTRAAPARSASDAPAEEPTVSPRAEAQPGGAAAAAPLEQPAPAPTTAPLKSPVAAPPPDLETPGAGQGLEDKWPLEAVRRPLTLPRGMASFGFDLSGNRPKNHVNQNPVTGGIYTFNSSVGAGVSLGLGVTDRVEVLFDAPRLFCVASDPPSGCDGGNAHVGTGAGVRFLAMREHGVQIAPQVGLGIAHTSPTVLRWTADVAFKITWADVAALVVAPAVRREIEPPPPRANHWLAYVPTEIELQATQRLLLFTVVEPWGSLADVDRGILLEVYGGAAYTFGPLGQISLEGGTYNVLSQPTWNSNVPEWFAVLSLAVWRY